LRELQCTSWCTFNKLTCAVKSIDINLGGSSYIAQQ